MSYPFLGIEYFNVKYLFLLEIFQIVMFLINREDKKVLVLLEY